MSGGDRMPSEDPHFDVANGAPRPPAILPPSGILSEARQNTVPASSIWPTRIESWKTSVWRNPAFRALSRHVTIQLIRDVPTGKSCLAKCLPSCHDTTRRSAISFARNEEATIATRWRRWGSSRPPKASCEPTSSSPKQRARHRFFSSSPVALAGTVALAGLVGLAGLEPATKGL